MMFLRKSMRKEKTIAGLIIIISAISHQEISLGSSHVFSLSKRYQIVISVDNKKQQAFCGMPAVSSHY